MADTGTTKKNKVTYGLKNVHIWPITSTDTSGKPTYGTCFVWPGAVEVGMDAEGSTDKLYADDGVYFVGTSNQGYSGDMTSADVPEEFHTEVLGETKDTNGVLIESADAIPKEFAMAFEFEGDAKGRRHLFYRCTAERPSVGSKTKEEKISPNTPKVKLTALPRLDNKFVKASVEAGEAGYENWYGTAPYEKATA